MYSLPLLKNNIGYSLGYGNKYDCTKITKNYPGPTSYEVPLNLISMTKGKTFGISRCLADKAFLETLPKKDLANPGPGKYDSPRTIGKDGALTSMLSKAAFQENKFKLNVPGPGEYNYHPTLNKEGKFLVSGFKDSGATKFNPIKKSSQYMENSKILMSSYPLSEYETNKEFVISKFSSPKQVPKRTSKRDLFNFPNISMLI